MFYFGLFILLATVSPLQSCEALYPRIFYNPSPSNELKVDMIAMFNTFSPCKDSYVRVQFLNSKEQYSCQMEKLQIKGQFVSYLEQYVHKCSLEIDSPSSIIEFRYKIEQGANSQSNSSPWNLVELSSETLPFRILVTANLQILNERLYTSFASSFNQLIKLRNQEIKRKENQHNFRINGIVINGGFAVGISEKRGTNFNKIMRMVSQYSSRWPLMINLGRAEIINKQDFEIIQKCFVLGGIGKGANRTGMQGYSFSRKANLAFIETSGQYFSINQTITEDYRRTLQSLQSFFSKNQRDGDEFNIVFNHYALFCEDAQANKQIYNCQKGAKNLEDLRNLLSGKGKQHSPTDLYIGAYHNNYQRLYPYREGKFMTLEESRYNRGDFININQGAGRPQQNMSSMGKKVYISKQIVGKNGFGILTIKGKAQLRKKSETEIISSQTVARKIYENNSHKVSSPKADGAVKLLTESYIQNESLDELQLFLLNYKHIEISVGKEMVVGDMFRIVSNPQPTTPRHHLYIKL